MNERWAQALAVCPNTRQALMLCLAYTSGFLHATYHFVAALPVSLPKIHVRLVNVASQRCCFIRIMMHQPCNPNTLICQFKGRPA
jgi:hypothetical protein